MTTTQTRRPISYYAQGIASAEKAADDYSTLLKVATDLGMEYEIERLKRNRDEMDDEVNWLMEEAIAVGYDVADFETCWGGE